MTFWSSSLSQFANTNDHASFFLYDHAPKMLNRVRFRSLGCYDFVILTKGAMNVIGIDVGVLSIEARSLWQLHPGVFIGKNIRVAIQSLDFLFYVHALLVHFGERNFLQNEEFVRYVPPFGFG
mmetsp:Transcript_46903/g.34338  ORF Transcript_46903/g.34338 Transcript_46903/m.34338 type:complete len:123 (-) Transcript_46903:175-543(-)